MKYQDFDYYKALEVDNSATILEIKKAYRKIAKIYHPDKAFERHEQEQHKTLKQISREGIELSESNKELLNKLEKKIEPFSKAAIAYETLSDPNKREEYDREKGIKKSCSASDPRKRNGCGKKEEAKKSDQAPKMNTKKDKDIESELLEALYHKNLKQAKTLVEQLNNLGKLHKLSSMLDSFVQNACNCDDWFGFFEEVLLYKKIDLENTFFYRTPLERACHLNNRKVAELLLRNGANVNGTDFNQERVPIYHALKHNNCNLVDLLFKYGAKIDVNNQVEKKIIANSHLYNKKTMEALLKYTSPKQNTQIYKHLYLLSNAAREYKYQEIFTLLLDKGVNRFDARLYEALYNQNLETARSLIADIENSSKCFTRDPENFGFLVEMACKNNDWFKFFQKVLSNKRIKIDLDVSIERCKGTALQYACKSKKKDVAELLLDKGADVNKVVNDRTAIFFATIRCTNSEEVKLVRLLLNRGADPYLGKINIRYLNHKNEELKALLDQNDKSRLSEAFQSKNLEIVKRLGRHIYSSDDLLIQNHLYYFVKNSCEDDWFKFFEEVLSEKNSKIDLNIDDGFSGAALHCACNQENENVIKLLLKHKVNVNKTCGSANQPPIYSLLKHNKHKLARLLYNSGAKTSSIIPEVEKAISNTSWYDAYTDETIKIIVEGADSAQYRTRILESFFNNKTLKSRDIEIIEWLLLKYLKIDHNLNLMETAIHKGNDQLMRSFNEVLDYRLSQHLIYQRFEEAKELIKKVKDLNKFEIKQHNLGHADNVLLLRYLVEKACSDNDWFKFFQEILSEQKSKIGLNLTIFPVHGTALNYARHKKNNDVENLLLKHGASNFCLESPKAISQVEQHVKEKPPKKVQNDEQASQLKVLLAVLSVKSKKSVIAASSLVAIAGIVSGIAIAVYSGMLAIGIAVGVCCLITAAVMYYCNSPANLLKDSNTEVVVNQGQEL